MAPLRAHIGKRLGRACPLRRVGQCACLMNGGSRGPIGEGDPLVCRGSPPPALPLGAVPTGHRAEDRSEPRNTAAERPWPARRELGALPAARRAAPGVAVPRPAVARPSRSALWKPTLQGNRVSPFTSFRLRKRPLGCSAPQGGPSRFAEVEFAKKREPPPPPPPSPPPPRWLPTRATPTPALRYKALISKLKKEKQ